MGELLAIQLNLKQVPIFLGSTARSKEVKRVC